jgi:hypothetical protein
MLTSEQIAELEALGTASVRQKLFLFGEHRAELLHGFNSADLKRSDVEAWLLEKHSERHTPFQRIKIVALTMLAAAVLGIAIAQIFFEYEY